MNVTFKLVYIFKLKCTRNIYLSAFNETNTNLFNYESILNSRVPRRLKGRLSMFSFQKLRMSRDGEVHFSDGIIQPKQG